jgi:hypothetical protein
MKAMKLKPYLLGTASEAERAAIDRSLLTDNQTLDEVSLAEDELIEAYLRQELLPTEQTQFERFFLADPERQQKLRLARALHRYANDPSKSSVQTVTAAAAHTPAIWDWFRRPLWQVAMAGLFLLALFGGVRYWLNRSAPVDIAHSSPSPTIVSGQPAAPPVGTGVLDVELIPGVVRAVNTRLKEVRLTPDIGTVQFKLLLRRGEFASDEAGQKLPGQFKPQTTTDGRFLIVPVRVSALGTGDYRIRLEGLTASGSERAETYSFRAKR